MSIVGVDGLQTERGNYNDQANPSWLSHEKQLFENDNFANITNLAWVLRSNGNQKYDGGLFALFIQPAMWFLLVISTTAHPYIKYYDWWSCILLRNISFDHTRLMKSTCSAISRVGAAPCGVCMSAGRPGAGQLVSRYHLVVGAAF